MHLLNRPMVRLLLVIFAIVASIIVIDQVAPKRGAPAAVASVPPTSPVRTAPQGGVDGPILPELRGIAGWINTEPLKLADKRGKVVLVDFWTYSCVNCLRTLPYLKEWQSKYASRGLVIVGVHTPEFEFEKDTGNVRKAVQKEGVTWAVAQDNDYETWNAYGNRYWPRKYLADGKGVVRYNHIGEGGYVETEQWIRKLLTEAGYNVSDITPATSEPSTPGMPTTREIYAGTQWTFGGYLGNAAAKRESGIGEYVDRGGHEENKFYVQGEWADGPEFLRVVGATADDPAHVAIKYTARGANVVARPGPGDPITVEALLDGQPVPREAAGDDITYDTSGRSMMVVDTARMYNVVRKSPDGAHELKLISKAPGFTLYTFTFSPS